VVLRRVACQYKFEHHHQGAVRVNKKYTTTRKDLDICQNKKPQHDAICFFEVE
jgi:hypothetical protein